MDESLAGDLLGDVGGPDGPAPFRFLPRSFQEERADDEEPHRRLDEERERPEKRARRWIDFCEIIIIPPFFAAIGRDDCAPCTRSPKSGAKRRRVGIVELAMSAILERSASCRGSQSGVLMKLANMKEKEREMRISRFVSAKLNGK